jgi:hypothetical protein
MIIKDQIDRAIAISRAIKNGRDAGMITQNTLPENIKNSINDYKILYKDYIPLNFKDEIVRIHAQQPCSFSITTHFQQYHQVAAGRPANSFCWGTIYFETEKKSYKKSIQLYSLVEENGVKFGICYGVDVTEESPFVIAVTNDNTLLIKIFEILRDNPNIKLFNSSKAGSDKIPGEVASVEVNSIEDIKNNWDSKSNLVAVFRENQIPNDIGQIFEEVISNLVELFNKTCERVIVQLPGQYNRETPPEFFLNEDNKPFMKTHPKNLILFGPPGTGKTYKTIEKAIRIANPFFVFPVTGDYKFNREEIKREYERLVDENKILFTTFHQSYSYEDFIEGIKPLPPDNAEDPIQYDIQKGVFKLACEYADASVNIATNNFTEAYSKLIDDISDSGELEIDTPNGATFFVSLNSRDNLNLLTTNNKNKQGVLTKEQLYEVAIGNKVKYWYGYKKGIVDLLISNYNLIITPINDKIKDNVVLIIDEINRGNVSQIFGELITLIEEDKRAGEIEELSTLLPYSKKLFKVPSNLYIIGTMNTADRSIEALDTALRRRFSFEELPPRYELLENEVSGIKLKDILAAINKRVEILLDRDHVIGHSYFIKIKNNDINALRNAFKDKIIPLLQEYFFGDYGKIALVLGEGFVEINEQNVTGVFATNKYDGFEDFISPKYKLIEIKDDFDIVTALNKTLG